MKKLLIFSLILSMSSGHAVRILACNTRFIRLEIWQKRERFFGETSLENLGHYPNLDDAELFPQDRYYFAELYDTHEGLSRNYRLWETKDVEEIVSLLESSYETIDWYYFPKEILDNLDPR